MLIINSTGTSQVTVTLYDMAINKATPYYTWYIQRKGSNDVITFCADDISIAPWYWSSFNLTVGNVQGGLTAGIIPITEGEWEYTIYETPTQYDLNTNNAIAVCETGIIVCGLTYSVVAAPVADNAIQPIPVFRYSPPTTTSTTTTTTTINAFPLIGSYYTNPGGGGNPLDCITYNQYPLIEMYMDQATYQVWLQSGFQSGMQLYGPGGVDWVYFQTGAFFYDNATNAVWSVGGGATIGGQIYNC